MDTVNIVAMKAVYLHVFVTNLAQGKVPDDITLSITGDESINKLFEVAIVGILLKLIDKTLVHL